MSTPATISIKDENDFTIMHTRWDGFIDDIFENLKTIKNAYRRDIELVRRLPDIPNLLLDEANETEKFLADDNDCATVSTLLSTSSLGHFHQSIDPFCYINAQITAEPKGDDITMEGVGEDYEGENLNNVPGLKTYDQTKRYQCSDDEWVLEVSGGTDSGSLKFLVSGMSKEEVEKKALSMPLSYIYTTDRLFKSLFSLGPDSARDLAVAARDGYPPLRKLFPMANQMGRFYLQDIIDRYGARKKASQKETYGIVLQSVFGVSLTSILGILNVSKGNTKEERVKHKLEELDAILPFDIFPESYANQLMASSRGRMRILPNTYQQNTTVDKKVILCGARRAPTIVFPEMISTRKECEEFALDNYSELGSALTFEPTPHGDLGVNFNKNAVLAATKTISAEQAKKLKAIAERAERVSKAQHEQRAQKRGYGKL